MTVSLSRCMRCARYSVDVLDNNACDAYPDGIPEAIITGEHDHTQPYPGDNGIRWEPAQEESITDGA